MSTALAESSQALFCAIADLVGTKKMQNEYTLKKYPSYSDFKKNKKNQDIINKAWNATNLIGITLKGIEDYLMRDVSWYESSLLTANTLLKEIASIDKDFKKIQGPGLDIFYSRGAKSGDSVMNDIDTLWKFANKKDKKFGDINKWSPADIYFVSKEARKIIKKEVDKSKSNKSYTWIELNKVCNDLLSSGDLLPLSLKKVISGKPQIVKYNFARSAEEKNLADLQYIKNKKSKSGRDIQIFFKDEKSQLKIRHDPYHSKFGANAALKCEIIVQGMGGRLGSIGSISILLSVIKDANIKSSKKFHDDLKKNFDAGFKSYKKGIDDLNVKYGVKSSDSHSKLPRKKYDEYKDERNLVSKEKLMDKIIPVIDKYFTNNKKTKTTFSDSTLMVQSFIKYASSRSPQSGKFVIAK